jgi:hypothetical protein
MNGPPTLLHSRSFKTNMHVSSDVLLPRSTCMQCPTTSSNGRAPGHLRMGELAYECKPEPHIP